MIGKVVSRHFKRLQEELLNIIPKIRAELEQLLDLSGSKRACEREGGILFVVFAAAELQHGRRYSGSYNFSPPSPINLLLFCKLGVQCNNKQKRLEVIGFSMTDCSLARHLCFLNILMCWYTLCYVIFYTSFQKFKYFCN